MNFDTVLTIGFTILICLICLPFLLKSKGLNGLKQYFLMRLCIHFFLKKQKKKFIFPDLKRTDLSAIDVGIIPSYLEYEVDNPCKYISKLHCDGIHFTGVDFAQNMIDICINRIEENLATVWIFLKLSDGRIYKLPFNTDSRKPYISNEKMFSSSGLQVKCMSPLRRWRISFNGLLQKDDTEDELVHVKFSFVWLAMSGVQELNFSYNTKDLAKAFVHADYSAEVKDLICFQDLQNRYEQWGQMLGTIKFKEEDEKELYFWSSRTRIIDTPLWNEDISCAKFYMYFMDGMPLKIESLSITNFLKNLTNGFTVSPHGDIRPFSNSKFSTDLSTESIKKELTFSFLLGGEKKKLQISFTGNDVTFLNGPQLQFCTVLKPFKVQMNDGESGFGILQYLSKASDECRQVLQVPPLLLKDPGYPSSKNTKYVLLLENELCKSALISGGKGSSLALLTELARENHEFDVPKGFVISTKAFEDHLQNNKMICSAINRLHNVSCKKIKADLKTECNKCSSLFSSTHISELLKNDIKAILLNMYDSLENVRFSIRSSAYGEDSENLSAAGQMLTVLGIRGIENVFRAIVQCWSSKFSFECVQYARQNGQSILSSMAVVVQEMVPSECSGVMFTVDPVTGDPLYPYITASFGLGEAVVSALADPDTIILKRNKDQSVQVFKKFIGSKKTQVFMKAGDGVEQKNYENQSDSCCLTDEWAEKIGSTGILVESCFCNPRDIEWAVYKNQLYLLQARPITTLHTETDFELIHDQDTPVRSELDFWTRANTGEVFLGATSPLGISIVVGGMDIYNHKQHILREKHYEKYCPYYFHILPATHKQITLNLVDTIFRNNEKEISSVQKAFEIALFGRPVITEEVHQAGVKKYGYASRKRKYFGLLFIPVLLYIIPKSIKKVEKQIAEYKLPLETYTSAQKTWDGILQQVNFYLLVCGVHGMATFLSSYFNMMLLNILSRGKKVWDAELYCDFATMLSSCSGVESADVPESLQKLAKTIAMAHGNSFSSLPTDLAYNLLKNEEEDAGKLFKEFIEHHGHRCVKEFDLYSKSWGMQPEILIPTLQSMVSSPNIMMTFEKKILSPEDILSQIKTPISSFNKKLLKYLLTYSRKYVCEREKTKSMLIKTVDWFRKSFCLLGDQMVHEGMLPDKELIFFFTLEEIKDILDFQKPGLVPKAVRRMHLHPKLNELKFPEIMKGIPTPIQMKQDVSSYSASFTLTGTPVCQGKVKAKAIVVLSLEEASKIENGDILITHATDIGWSPYFPLLSGVVTVLGGLISHGAVVAREYGLPCVVGVENATIAFKSGDIVILNGAEGTVTKILETNE